MGPVEKAIGALRRGEHVLIFDSDGRERETDMVFASEHVTYGSIMTLRKEAGGLICTTVPASTWEKIGLPFLAEVLGDASKKYPLLGLLAPDDLPYDTKSAFSLTINHRKTFTGIPDGDRALTISEFAKFGIRAKEMSAKDAMKDFGANFRAPGHVFLLNAQPRLLAERKGHTELSNALLEMAGMYPSATICEMMGEDGHSLPKEKAQEYAKRSGKCYLAGADIIEHWEKSKG